VPAVVEKSIQLKARVESHKIMWMQQGIVNIEAAWRTKEAGFTVVIDQCMFIEHERLST
jgi:predicted CoA-binding protein